MMKKPRQLTNVNNGIIKPSILPIEVSDNLSTIDIETSNQTKRKLVEVNVLESSNISINILNNSLIRIECLTGSNTDTNDVNII